MTIVVIVGALMVTENVLLLIDIMVLVRIIEVEVRVISVGQVHVRLGSLVLETVSLLSIVVVTIVILILVASEVMSLAMMTSIEGLAKVVFKLAEVFVTDRFVFLVLLLLHLLVLLRFLRMTEWEWQIHLDILIIDLVRILSSWLLVLRLFVFFLLFGLLKLRFVLLFLSFFFIIIVIKLFMLLLNGCSRLFFRFWHLKLPVKKCELVTSLRDILGMGKLRSIFSVLALRGWMDHTQNGLSFFFFLLLFIGIVVVTAGVKELRVSEGVLSLFNLVRDSILTRLTIESKGGISAILVRLGLHLGLSLVSLSLHFERLGVDLETTFEAGAESWIILRVDLSFSPSLLCLFVNDSEL